MTAREGIGVISDNQRRGKRPRREQETSPSPEKRSFNASEVKLEGQWQLRSQMKTARHCRGKGQMSRKGMGGTHDESQ